MNNLNSKGMVLVTGGTGFLGAYIVKELVEKGYAVRAIRRGNTQPSFIPSAVWRDVEWFTSDIFDVSGLEEAMEGVDVVVHAAGKVSFARSELREMRRTNIEGTANVVNLALAQQVKRLIHVSSVAALGRAGNGGTVTEEKKWENSKWNTNYAISKFHGEAEVWRGMGEGLPVVVVNPTTMLGYGDWSRSSCTLFRSGFREFPWYTEGVNGFVDVRDVASAIVGLLDSDVSGQRYILNGDNWSFRHLFETIADEFGKKRPSREATPFLAGIAWRLETLKKLLTGRPSILTKESALVARSRTYFDNSKILRQLPGFRFTPLEETIRVACKAYLQELPPQSVSLLLKS